MVLATPEPYMLHLDSLSSQSFAGIYPAKCMRVYELAGTDCSHVVITYALLLGLSDLTDNFVVCR